MSGRMSSERCPVCGVKVKSENLSRHIKKVHPDAKEGAEKRTKKAGQHSPASRKVLYAVLAVVVIAIIIAAVFLMAPPPGEPDIQVDPLSYDFGTMPQEARTTRIIISNEGDSSLKITGIGTDCVCTSAVFTVGGRVSPVFRMPDPSVQWSETLLPGQTGYLDVTYDPSIVNHFGQTTRVVNIDSNDPDTSRVQVVITAIVVP